MLSCLQIQPYERLKNLSKGTKEKVQLILVMSRNADLYILDEVVFIRQGNIILQAGAEQIKQKYWLVSDRYCLARSLCIHLFSFFWV